MSDDSLHAALAAGLLRSDERCRALLQSIVTVARAIFRAEAASIFLLDEAADELVFEAIAGRGSEELVGARLPSSTGIAGWVLVTRQPIVVEDASADTRFAGDFAQTTGYVPRGLMAVPLLHEEGALGVLEVLDRPRRPQFALEEMELLGMFAEQAAVALDLVLAGRRARAALAGHSELEPVARLAAALDALDGPAREAGLRLLAELEIVLGKR